MYSQDLIIELWMKFLILRITTWVSQRVANGPALSLNSGLKSIQASRKQLVAGPKIATRVQVPVSSLRL